MSENGEQILGRFRTKAASDGDAGAQAPRDQRRDEPSSKRESARVLPPGQTMLDLQFKSGERMALAYIDLRAMRFDPTSGIVLEFAIRSIAIKGRRLHGVYEMLSRHQVSYLCEEGEGFRPAGDEKPLIEKIEIAVPEKSCIETD